MSTSRSMEWWRSGLATSAGAVEVAAQGSKVSGRGVPFWALMAFTFILLIAPQIFFPWLIPLRIALVTAAVGITAHLMETFVRRQPVMRWTREMRIAACLVGWAVLTVPLSTWPSGSVAFLFNLYFKTLAIFWLLANVVTTLTRLRQVAWGLTLMAVPMAWTAVGNFLTGVFVPGGQHGPVKRIVGYDASPLAGNPNDLAMLLNLILPFSVALLLATRRPVLRCLLLCIVCLDAAAVILTFSRAGFLTLATIFALHVIKLRRPGWAVAALVVALICVPLLPAGYLSHMGTITDIESDPTGSAQKRWDNIVAGLKAVLASPILGAGVGMSILALNEIGGPRWTELHNVYLQYAVELGIPGLVLFALLLVGCIGNARYVQRQSTNGADPGQLFYLALAIEISLVGFVVGGFFSPVAYHFYFYYLAGLAVAARAVSDSGVYRCRKD